MAAPLAWTPKTARSGAARIATSPHLAPDWSGQHTGATSIASAARLARNGVPQRGAPLRILAGALDAIRSGRTILGTMRWVIANRHVMALDSEKRAVADIAFKHGAKAAEQGTKHAENALRFALAARMRAGTSRAISGALRIVAAARMPVRIARAAFGNAVFLDAAFNATVPEKKPTPITLYSGNTKRIVFTVRDEKDNAAPIQYADSIIYAIAKTPAKTAQVKKTFADGVKVLNNTITVPLAPEDTQNLSGSYYHEVQVVDAAGNSETVFAAPIRFQKTLID